MKRAWILTGLLWCGFLPRPACGIDPGTARAFAADNHVLRDADGRLHLVYLGWDGAQTDVFHTTSDDEGFTWSAPVNLTNTPDLVSSEPPDIALDAAGDVAFVWSEGKPDSSSKVYLFYESWQDPPVVIGNTGHLASGPKIEFDEGGTAHVVWYDEGDPDSRLLYERCGGCTGAPTALGPETGYVLWPSMALDGSRVHIAFSYTTAWGVAPIDVFYLMSDDGGISWSDTTRLSDTGAPSQYPHVTVDAAGTVHVVWQEGEGADAEIYHAWNSGKGWSAPENLSVTPGTASVYPTLSTDVSGTLHLLWSDEADGDFDVWSRSLSGTSAWTASRNLTNTSGSSMGATQIDHLAAYGSLFCWVEGEGPYDIRCSSSYSEVLFTDVAAAAGLDSLGITRGTAWGDMDRDGADELVVLKWSTFGHRSWLYRHAGGVFVPIQALPTSGFPNGAAWGDCDNDGYRDLAVVGLGETHLYHSNGSALVDVTTAAGLDASSGGWALAWADYDRDGSIDLFVTGGASDSCALYHNDGGTFSDSAGAAGVAAAGVDCHGAAWGDYDGDGWPDLYVTVYGANLLYHNEGNGTFTERAGAAGVNDAGDGESCAWADSDGDGDLDLFVVNSLGPNRLYRNRGDGSFEDVTDWAGVASQGQGTVVLWGDVDNDADPDLLVGGGTMSFFRNNGAGQFAEVGREAGLHLTAQFYGAGWSDFDADGDLDLFLGESLNSGKDYLLRNGPAGSPAHPGVDVDLTGEASNRDGIGAWVTLHAGGKSWLAEASGGLGYSQSSATLHFGARLEPDSILVRWPSGTIDRLYDPDPGARLAVHEGATAPGLWPGDTDNDGDVDGDDVLPLVVHWHTEVDARVSANPWAWTFQALPTWHPEDAEYADTDADGRVEAADLLPIGVHWGRTHARGSLSPASLAPVIEDHAPYVELYRALYRSLEDAQDGAGFEALRAHLESLIALGEGRVLEYEDRITGFAPNPAVEGAEIRFSTARAGTVRFRIYDVGGRLVRTLDAPGLGAGPHALAWDGKGEAGRPVAPGVYLCRMERGAEVRVRKLVVVQ